jgi:hypothetical protein
MRRGHERSRGPGLCSPPTVDHPKPMVSGAMGREVPYHHRSEHQECGTTTTSRDAAWRRRSRQPIGENGDFIAVILSTTFPGDLADIQAGCGQPPHLASPDPHGATEPHDFHLSRCDPSPQSPYADPQLVSRLRDGKQGTTKRQSTHQVIASGLRHARFFIRRCPNIATPATRPRGRSRPRRSGNDTVGLHDLSFRW